MRDRQRETRKGLKEKEGEKAREGKKKDGESGVHTEPGLCSALQSPNCISLP